MGRIHWRPHPGNEWDRGGGQSGGQATLHAAKKAPPEQFKSSPNWSPRMNAPAISTTRPTTRPTTPARPQKFSAVYIRVSSRKQDTRSQEPDLRRWADAQEGEVKFFRDKATGKTMARPGWDRLMEECRVGRVSAIVCWRLDRLGRTAKGLTALFEELRGLKVNLVSLKDGLDLSTAAGRLMANVLASVAQFETELRGERVAAGQAAAKAAGKVWGGSEKGRRTIRTADKAEVVRKLAAEGESISAIARAVGLSRPTIYKILESKPAKGKGKK